MGTKKSPWVLFGILVISAWVLGSVIQAGAETLKLRTVLTATKDERMPVGDEEGHVLVLQIMQGLALFENGEIAKVKSRLISDTLPGKGGQVIGYSILTFDDGSTIIQRFQRLISETGSAKSTSDLIKGTGRFEGIKGTVSSTGRNWLPSGEEAGRVYSDSTITYTLPTK